MEGESYLMSGFGIRCAMEAQMHGWLPLEKLASVWQPNRLKGILVGSEYGTPYLAATQVFDQRPTPRKWLSIEQIQDSESLFLQRGNIIVTRSGTVGRATVAFTPHLNVLISDDLLRVDPADAEWWGWIYAYLRSSHARQMMVSAHYGHIIKHLETSHLNALPVPVVRPELRGLFNKRVTEILELRDRSHELSLEAERLFESAVGSLPDSDEGENGFVAHASDLLSGRRRFDASPNNPRARAIREHLERNGKGIVRLVDAGFDAWLPARFRRISASDGVAFVDSADLFEINPDITKRIADLDFGDAHQGRVRAGWVLLSRSGQIYALNGSVVLANGAHEGYVISDHIIRIAPNDRQVLPTGYVYVALSHPRLGRPIVKALAYGSSVPEIEPADAAVLGVVRLDTGQENEIAGLAQTASSSKAAADLMENEVGELADHIIKRFLSGDTMDLEMNI